MLKSKMEILKMKTICDIYENYIKFYEKEETFYYFENEKLKGITGKDFYTKVQLTANFLKNLGFKKGDKVAIISQNRPEWHICDYAILSIGSIVVPVYPTLTKVETKYIIQHSEIKCAFVSSKSLAEKLIEDSKPFEPLQKIVVFEKIIDKKEFLVSFDEVIKSSVNIFYNNPIEIDENDIATIIYTSGTTNKPKGVMLTHKNIVSNVFASIERFELRKDDVGLSFLPLAHSFERLACYAYLAALLKFGYAENIDRLLLNMRILKPTIVCAVPRLFERVYTKLNDNMGKSPYLKKLFMYYGIKIAFLWAKEKMINKKSNFILSLLRFFFDLTFYRNIRKRMGGRLRFFVSGGAPLNIDIALFFYGAKIKIVEGYGMTETSPVITANSNKEIVFGSVGKPLSNITLKIAEDGEILVKGPNVMKGYYKNEEETSNAFDEEGFLKTGDIGHLDNEGRLYITDRKKEIIVTAGGKNIAPQWIESVLKENKYVNQAIVIGDRKPYLTVLIYPNWDLVIEYAKRKGVSKTNIKDLKEHPQIKHLFDNVLKRTNQKLSRFEQLKDFRLLENELTIENGELTPTLKIKRRVVIPKYKALIDSMYERTNENRAEKNN